METLATHIQDLPQELYNEIFDLVVYSREQEEVRLARIYKPPTSLQIDSKSRSLFAKEYYSHTTFLAPVGKNCAKWLASLPLQHLALVKNIRSQLRNITMCCDDDAKDWHQSLRLYFRRLAIGSALQDGLIAAVTVELCAKSRFADASSAPVSVLLSSGPEEWFAKLRDARRDAEMERA